MSKELWVVGSSLNPLILSEDDWFALVRHIRRLGLTYFDNKADYENYLKGEQ